MYVIKDGLNSCLYLPLSMSCTTVQCKAQFLMAPLSLLVLCLRVVPRHPRHHPGSASAHGALKFVSCLKYVDSSLFTGIVLVKQ